MQENRKVIFINISFNSYVVHTEAVFTKLNCLFNSYCDSIDYLLWWRPHPTLENNLQNYDRNLFQRYLALKAKFINSSWGVYDIDIPFETALDLSDIYFGDCGTVAQKFMDNGKKVIYPNYTGIFFPIGICKFKDYIYGTDHDTSAIVRYDIKKNLWEYVMPIRQTYGMQKAFHNSVTIGDRIIYIPYKAECLVIFDAITEVIKVIDLKIKKEKVGKEKTMFWGFYYYKNMLYLIPAGYAMILAVNMSTYKVVEQFDISDITDQSQIITWLSWVEIEPGVLALASMQKNQVLIIDFNLKRKQLYTVGREEFKYSEIRRWGDDLYLVVKNVPAILKWKYKEDTLEEILFDQNQFGKYGKSIFDDYANTIYNGKLVCIPAKSENAYIVNLSSKDIRKVSSLNKYIDDDISISQFDTVVVSENEIYMQNKQYKFLIFDIETESVVEEAECRLPLVEIMQMEIDLIRSERN